MILWGLGDQFNVFVSSGAVACFKNEYCCPGPKIEMPP